MVGKKKKDTVKPVCNDHPRCQEKVVVPSRSSLYWIQWWMEIFTIWQMVFPDRMVFPEGVVSDRFHCNYQKMSFSSPGKCQAAILDLSTQLQVLPSTWLVFHSNIGPNSNMTSLLYNDPDWMQHGLSKHTGTSLCTNRLKRSMFRSWINTEISIQLTCFGSFSVLLVLVHLMPHSLEQVGSTLIQSNTDISKVCHKDLLPEKKNEEVTAVEIEWYHSYFKSRGQQPT